MTRTIQLVCVVAVLALVGAACAAGDVSAPSTSALSEPTTTSAPTTTSTPTTTTVAAEDSSDEEVGESVLSDEDLALANLFVSAFNVGDLEVFMNFFDPSATVNTSLTRGSGLDQLRRELAFQWALNAKWAIQECKPEYGAISCDVEVLRDDLTPINGPINAKVRLTVENGDIKNLGVLEDARKIRASVSDFHAWVSDQRSEDVQSMFLNFPTGPSPKLTEESVALWVELIPQYIASVTE